MAPLPRHFPPEDDAGSRAPSAIGSVALVMLALSVFATLLARVGAWPAVVHWSPVLLLVAAAIALLHLRGDGGSARRAAFSAARSAIVVATLSAVLSVPLGYGPAFVVGVWGVVVGLGGETVAVKGVRVPVAALSATVLVLGLALRFHIV